MFIVVVDNNYYDYLITGYNGPPSLLSNSSLSNPFLLQIKFLSNNIKYFHPYNIIVYSLGLISWFCVSYDPLCFL